MRNRAGDVRTLDACQVTDFGFYGQRLFHRPASRAIGQRLWLLPSLGLRVISWIPRPGASGIEDYYIDIAAITVDGPRFHMTDYYLDIRLWENDRAELIDHDEFVAAVAAGHLDQRQAKQAMADAFRAVDGIARHNYRLAGWLADDHGIHLTWQTVLRSALTVAFALSRASTQPGGGIAGSIAATGDRPQKPATGVLADISDRPMQSSVPLLHARRRVRLVAEGQHPVLR